MRGSPAARKAAALHPVVLKDLFATRGSDHVGSAILDSFVPP
jgi:hypothetical protein